MPSVCLFSAGCQSKSILLPFPSCSTVGINRLSTSTMEAQVFIKTDTTMNSHSYRVIVHYYSYQKYEQWAHLVMAYWALHNFALSSPSLPKMKYQHPLPNPHNMGYSTSILTFLALAVIIAQTAANSSSGHGKKRCYVKSQKCCYVYKPCGAKMRREAKRYPCPYKACKEVCTKKCKNVAVKQLNHSCRNKRIRAGKKCYHDSFQRICKNRYRNVRVCNTPHDITHKPRCGRVCHPRCKEVHAFCEKIIVYRYPKLCAKAECGPTTRSGRTKAPSDKIGDAKIVKIIHSPRRKH